jgi:hypothetical protein
VATPRAQIAFRGVPVSQLTGIHVSGSHTGAHSGHVEGDSDGRGGSFLPDKPFSATETVTVRTPLDIVGGRHGTFHFTVADPAGQIPFRRHGSRRAARGEVYSFHSVPGLHPAAVRVTRNSGADAGDIFVAPQTGPSSNGAELLDPRGRLVWYHPAPANDEVTDFRVQTYQREPVLTWWQGNVNEGTGRGEDLIYNSSYQQVAVVRAANGLSADLHEFQLTPHNAALITSFYPVYWDARSVNRPRHQIVFDCVVQEIDIATGLVLFQWDSLDHVPLTSSYASLPPRRTRIPFDYFHVNSVDLDQNGNLIVSARNTWAVYKLNHGTGKVIWTLGGKHSSFRMGAGASFAFQHDVRVRSIHDWYVTIFDDGAGPPAVHSQSRALELFLDVAHKRARMVFQRQHSPGLSAPAEGSVQQLNRLHQFVGWGGEPYLTEYDRSGHVVFDAHFTGPNASYRAYRFPWTGKPQQPPAVVATDSGASTQVWASWAGATNAASWRVLGGSSASSLTPVVTSRNHGFETGVKVAHEPFVAVQALDSSGHVLAQSSAVSST